MTKKLIDPSRLSFERRGVPGQCKFRTCKKCQVEFWSTSFAHRHCQKCERFLETEYMPQVSKGGCK